MPWKLMDIREQRVQFVVAASRLEKPFGSLCEEFEISRPTGYLWLERYRLDGIKGVAERSRRPRFSPAQTLPALENQVVWARQRYPDWGARKLQELLRRRGVELARSTIHRILLRRGLVRPQDRHPAALERFERRRPNELWQMDFKGPMTARQKMGPLSVLDDHSRYVIALDKLENQRTEAVREHLESAFQRCGLPESMLMDHGTPWWSMPSSGGLTVLSLWLMRQGIGLHWSRVRHPQTQGKVERFHGELQRALDCRTGKQEPTQAWLDCYRWEHNYVRPHEALEMATPSTRWYPSPRRYDPHPPAWEYESGAWVRKVDCEGKLDVGG
ncbi:MAG: IS481 family transposase, partial [Terracidiphilus sp.]|nr:IS481 family transposase [Terracidiphilus sp.]